MLEMLKHRSSGPYRSAMGDRGEIASTTVPQWAHLWFDSSGLDPFAPDEPGEPADLTVDRQMLRVAIAAAETASRFAREGVDHDPIAWMLAPRALFDGAPALLACRHVSGLTRATVLHGLSLGLDADADDINDLLADDDPSERMELEVAEDDALPKLFTCFVDGQISDGDHCVQAFCASVASSSAEMRRRLATRFGGILADAVVVHEGIDLNHPLADYLVPDGLLRVLAMAEREPAGEFGQGLDVVLEQRFAA